MPPSLTTQYAELLRERVGVLPPDASAADINEILRLLGRWRSQLIAHTFLTHHGPNIIGGPFAGMAYIDHPTEGALAPRLFGTYESELHPHFAAVLAKGVDCLIDVGCAEGYYAVGFARMAPQLAVYAYDIDEAARTACAELAARNGVADRVTVGGEFKPADFAAFADRSALVLVDAEGAEVDILEPVPALARQHIIVETHDIIRRGAMKTLTDRFSPTHHIVRVDQHAKAFDPPDWLKGLSHLDQLLAVWEWRAGPTPWLVMTPKA